jgi:hypothetical protein
MKIVLIKSNYSMSRFRIISQINQFHQPKLGIGMIIKMSMFLQIFKAIAWQKFKMIQIFRRKLQSLKEKGICPINSTKNLSPNPFLKNKKVPNQD